MKGKHYKVYLHTSEIDSNNNYQTKYIGQAKGHIDSGAVVMSNSTKGNGNVIGVIIPQKTAIFTLSGDVLTKPTGEKMSFQNETGSHDLSFLTSVVEFILQKPISNVSGRTYGGIGPNKGYLMSFVHEGEEKQVTITNESVEDEVVNNSMDPTLKVFLPSAGVSAANSEIDNLI